MTQVINANFKYTVPISKAEADGDGLYIYGEAAGTEIDKQKERMSPSAIKAFAQQIKDRYFEGNPIPYVDEHDKSTSGRGVLRHLGDVIDGGITGEDHLWVKVRLNEKNPAATFLYSQIVDEGKQYGMSIQGSVLEFADEIAKSIGQKVRTFKSVVLDHIANTTKPVWTPSLGTVLNRAVIKALEDEGNGEEMAEEIVVESTETPETTTEETPAVETNQATAAEVTEETTVAEATADETAQPTALEALNSKFDSMLNAMNTLVTALKPATPAPVAKAETDETTEPATVVTRKEYDDLAAELARVKELSLTQKPPVIAKAEMAEFEDVLKTMSPQERLRVALAAQHGEEY